MPGNSSQHWIPTLSKLTTNPSPERVQDNVNTALQGFQNQVADGQLLSLSQDTSTASGSPPSFAAIVNHPLGRKPQAILQGLANCFCFIAIDPKQPNGIDLTKQIQLDFLSGSSAAFPTNLVVPLWFF